MKKVIFFGALILIIILSIVFANPAKAQFFKTTKEFRPYLPKPGMRHTYLRYNSVGDTTLISIMADHKIFIDFREYNVMGQTVTQSVMLLRLVENYSDPELDEYSCDWKDSPDLFYLDINKAIDVLKEVPPPKQ